MLEISRWHGGPSYFLGLGEVNRSQAGDGIARWRKLLDRWTRGRAGDRKWVVWIAMMEPVEGQLGSFRQNGLLKATQNVKDGRDGVAKANVSRPANRSGERSEADNVGASHCNCMFSPSGQWNAGKMLAKDDSRSGIDHGVRLGRRADWQKFWKWPRFAITALLFGGREIGFGVWYQVDGQNPVEEWCPVGCLCFSCRRIYRFKDTSFIKMFPTLTGATSFND